MPPQAMHYSGQNFTVRFIRRRFFLRLELSIEFQQSWILDIFSVGRQNRTERTQNASFPVDESAVAVERQTLKT